MFIIQLKFSDSKDLAGQFMDGHNEWLKRGFDDGIFLLAGSLGSNLGGGILAHNISLPDLQNRINEDPFVVQNVVAPELIEIMPVKTDEKLKFLLN